MNEETKKYVDTTVNTVVSREITTHRHTGSDAPRIKGSGIVGAPQAKISPPSGGVTEDVQARASINQIITALKNLGFTL